MVIWLLIGIGVVIASALLLWWRVRRRKRAMQVLMRHNQKRCDQAVAQALTQLDWQVPRVSSAPVADVWGHGIMAFEYALTDAGVTQGDFATALKQQTPAPVGNEMPPALVVTDWWVRDGLVHFDVAFVTNAATREYVQDVRRV